MKPLIAIVDISKKTFGLKPGAAAIFIILIGSLQDIPKARGALLTRSYGQYQFAGSNAADTEKKVDYIERIYFSGKNKADLITMISVTVQALDGQLATKSVAKQYAFYQGLKVKQRLQAAPAKLKKCWQLGFTASTR